MMSNYKYIFKLELMVGLALIQKEITADYFDSNKDLGVYIFKSRDNSYCEGILSQYPIGNTVIVAVDENPDFVEPDRPRRGFEIPREFEGGF